MIKLFLLLGLLVVGIIAGPFIYDKLGYVLISLGNWTVETTLPGLVVAILLFWLLWEGTKWLLTKAFRLSKGSFDLFGSWQSRRQQVAFTKGLVALDEQNFHEAQKQLEKAAKADAFSGVDLLAAAQAALRLNQTDKARELWQKAARQPATELAATLNLVRLALKQENHAEALRLLEGLHDKHKDHPSVVAHWAEALAGLNRWHELKDKLKGWKKHLGMERYDHWMRAAALGTFAEIASKEGANELKARWQTLPRSARKDPAQQAAYVRQLISQDMHNDAVEALVSFLDAPEPGLLALFKDIRAKQPTAALKKLENWLKQDDANIAVLSALGHLAYNAGEYRLAERVITRRLNLQQDKTDMLLLAQIKEATQQPMQALEIYKQTLSGE